MSLQIRPATSDDYPAIAVVNNLAHPTEKSTVERFAQYFDSIERRGFIVKLVATVDNEIVGFLIGGTTPRNNDLARLALRTCVAPEFRNRGVGNALYVEAYPALTKVAPKQIGTRVDENDHGSIRFAERRGFKETMREWESILEASTFNIAAFDDPRPRLESEGIVFKTLEEISCEPDYLQKLYSLDSAVHADVPALFPLQSPPFEVFCEMLSTQRTRLDDAYFIAIDGENYVGMTMLFKKFTDPTTLRTGTTGVLRSHRRRGIALALKLSALRYAKDHGYLTVHTENASINRPMLSINEMLGFVKQSAKIFMVKNV